MPPQVLDAPTQQPANSAELMWWAMLCVTIRAYDAHPYPETAAARDAAALGYQRASGIKDPCVPLASFRPKRFPSRSRR
jgi:hypothetical protein